MSSVNIVCPIGICVCDEGSASTVVGYSCVHGGVKIFDNALHCSPMRLLWRFAESWKRIDCEGYIRPRPLADVQEGSDCLSIWHIDRGVIFSIRAAIFAKPLMHVKRSRLTMIEFKSLNHFADVAFLSNEYPPSLAVSMELKPEETFCFQD